VATGITKATTSDLEYMQRTVIASARYTREHSVLMAGLTEKFELGAGESTITLPKMGAMGDAEDLVDGIDMTTSQQLENTYTDLTTAEIGIKTIVTDKLVRQMNDSVFKMCGRLLGDSMKRKVEKDGLAMFTGFSTGLGGAGITLTTQYLSVAVTRMEAEGEPAPRPYAYVGHPWQVQRIMDSVAKVGTYPLPEGWSAQLLKDYWKGTLDVFGIPVFASGLITRDGDDDAIGCLFSKSALGYIVSKEAYTERERDASLRAYELVHVQDSDWAALDDNYAIKMTFDAEARTGA